jgi:polyamine oxidase
VRMAKFLMKFDALFEASDLRHLSLKEFSHDRTEGDLLPPGGYFRVINAIYQACNPKTLFNKKVVAIDHSQPLVQIRTSDGSTYQARRVICSLPLGVLKKNIVQFEPELPPSHQKAIAGITCGIANKIYLKF